MGLHRWPWVPRLATPVVASIRDLAARTGRVFTVPPAFPSPEQRPPLLSCPCASREFRQVLGNSSPALFQLPHSYPPPAPQVGGWRLLFTLPLPRPLPLPHHTPTPRRGHATGRSLGSALPGAVPFLRAGPGGAGGGGGGAQSGCREPPTGVAGSCTDLRPPPRLLEPSRRAREVQRWDLGLSFLAFLRGQAVASELVRSL